MVNISHIQCCKKLCKDSKFVSTLFRLLQQTQSKTSTAFFFWAIQEYMLTVYPQPKQKQITGKAYAGRPTVVKSGTISAEKSRFIYLFDGQDLQIQYFAKLWNVWEQFQFLRLSKSLKYHRWTDKMYMLIVRGRNFTQLLLRQSASQISCQGTCLHFLIVKSSKNLNENTLFFLPYLCSIFFCLFILGLALLCELSFSPIHRGGSWVTAIAKLPACMPGTQKSVTCKNCSMDDSVHPGLFSLYCWLLQALP